MFLCPKEVEICAWVRTNRAQSQFGFLNVNDGSFFDNLQVVYEQNLDNFESISNNASGSTGLDKWAFMPA